MGENGMASLEEAQIALRALGGDLSVSEEGNFLLAHPRHQISLKPDELDAYLSVKPQIKKISETAIFLDGHYEHVVQFEGDGPRRYRRPDEVLKMVSPDGDTEIEISRPSAIFALQLTDKDELDRSLRRFIGPAASWRFPERVTTISDYFRLYTIKVRTKPGTPLSKNQSRLHDLAESAIFHFGYGKGVAVSFTRSWERTYYWVGRKANEEVQFPRRTYKSELVSYYNLALSTDSLVLGFLALYKILEYFYTSVSESDLHSRLTELLVAPDFSHKKASKLRELAKSVRKFDARHDEATALRLVIDKYFGPSEIRTWIENYEAENGPHFTKSEKMFSHDMRVDISDATVVPNVANRVYKIRNALVHHKEGEISRFIPYTGQEEMLQKDVRLLLHLAEQVIVKTGADI